MTSTLPAAGPAVSPVLDRSLSCWADNDQFSRCYGKAVSDLGLCAVHLDAFKEEPA